MDFINVVVETRRKGAEIARHVLYKIDGISEADLSKRFLGEMAKDQSLFPQGWYDPPPGGGSFLFTKRPYDRLKFETLRDPKFWPSHSFRFEPETVAIMYQSIVDRKTGLLGDIGFTVYRGADEQVQKHIRGCHNIIIEAANHAEVGQKFSDLYAFATSLFQENSKRIGWMTTTHDPMKINLGHIIPGSVEGDGVLGSSFEETKESIRSKRFYINEAEQFIIPTNCAFTFEARLIDSDDDTLPNVLFHVIVVFEKGKKTVLSNFNEIFTVIGMDYLKV